MYKAQSQRAICIIHYSLLFILFSAISSFAAARMSWLDKLTSEEQLYIQNNSPFKVQLAEDWPPFNFTLHDLPQGYVNDFLLLIVAKTGVRFDFISGYSWSQYMQMLLDNEIDFISNMTITQERRTQYSFSDKSVIDIFDGILTSKVNQKEGDLEKYHDKIIAVVQGYSQEELLRRYYPEIKLLQTENLLDSIKQVMAGNAHAAVGSDAVFNYLIKKHLLADVISTPITSNIIFPSSPHHFAVRKGNTTLLSILNKAIAEITPEELNRLQSKWSVQGDTAAYQFTSEEHKYLGQKKQITMCVDPNWMPIEKIENGKHIGIVADHISLISQSLNIPITLVPTTTWQESLSYARDRKCDILSLAMSTPERRRHMFFTEPFYSVPLVIATNYNANFLPDLSAASGKKLGVKADYAFGPILQEKYPELEIVEISSIETGLEMVKQKKLFGVIGGLPTVAHTIQKSFLGDLKIAGKTDEELEMRMAVRNDEPLLLTIMNKAIANITEENRQDILNNWISVKYEGSKDYRLLVRFLFGAFLVITLLLYRQYTLRKFSKKLQIQNKEIRAQANLLKDTQEQLLLTQYAVDSSAFPLFWLKNKPDSLSVEIIHANEAAIAVLGYSIDEIHELSVNDFDVQFKEQLYVELPGSRQVNVPKSFSSVYLKKDGSTFPVKVYVSSFDYKDNVYHFVFFNDISAQEEMAEKLHRSMKMEAVGLMAGGVAHDLNNILSGVVSYPDLILTKLSADSEIRPHVESVKRSGKQAARVVEDLLTVARGIVATKETANLNDFITEYFSSPEYEALKARYPRITGSATLAKDLNNISCSPTHVKKTIMNLVANAYEAIEDLGEVEISTQNIYVEETIMDYQEISPGNYVVLTIKDTGPGIPPETYARIFEPFYTKKVMGRSGTGLGLAIVWNSVQDHHGKIALHSSAQGTSISVYLPKTDGKPVYQFEAEITSELKGKGERILVVDDSLEQLEMVKHILDSLNYISVLASSGEQAIEFVEKNTFDLVLLDMIMDQGLNGRETYERIKKINPQQKAIVVSGFSENGDIEDTLYAGAKKFIRKPYSMHQIAKAVREVIDG